MKLDTEPLPGYHSEIAVLAATLQGGTQEWREEIGDVDEDTIVWQAFPGSHSIGALILHMIECEAWWCQSVAPENKEWTDTELESLCGKIDQMNVVWPTPPRKPLSYFYELQDRYRAQTLEVMKSFDPAKEVGIPGHEKHTFTLRWIISHIIQHESYHAGQAVFLRLLREKQS